MINQALVQSLISAKLDEIVLGKTPDGFKEKVRNENRIELLAEQSELFGIKCTYLRLSFIYKNTEIIITHE